MLFIQVVVEIVRYKYIQVFFRLFDIPTFLFELQIENHTGFGFFNFADIEQFLVDDLALTLVHKNNTILGEILCLLVFLFGRQIVDIEQILVKIEIRLIVFLESIEDDEENEAYDFDEQLDQSDILYSDFREY